MKKLLTIITLLLTVPGAANAVTANPSEVKTAVMQYCLGNGGDKGICECSYNNALKVMTLDDLALLQSQLTSHVEPDGALMAKFTKATEDCGKRGAVPASASSGGDDMLALPPPPPPPVDTGMEDMSNKPADSKTSSTYLSDIKPDNKNLPQLIDDPDSGDAAAPTKPVKHPKLLTTAPKVQTSRRPNGYFGEYDQRLFNAAKSGDIEALRAYATKVYDFNAHDQSGDTPLIASVKAGQATSVGFLTTNGANVNERNLSGQTALDVASYIHRPDLVEILINAHAKLNEAYGAGYTPLLLAIMQQDLTTVQLLLQNHAGFSRNLPNGNTELHIAATGGNVGIIQALAAAGAKINQKNREGYTPLMVASYTGNLAAVQALLGVGANAGVKDANGRTALTLAQAAGKQNVVGVLAQYSR